MGLSKTLFEISQNVAALQDILIECDGDLTDKVDFDAIEKWFEENRQDLHRKLDGYCWLIQEHEARGDAYQKRAEAMLKSAKQHKIQASALKERALFHLIEMGIDNVETDSFRIRVANNGGVTPLRIKVEDYHNLPLEYQRIEVTPNTTAIRQALERGDEIVTEFAEYGEKKKHLRIK